MIEERATFIGKNGSLGFKTGKEYDIQIAIDTKRKYISVYCKELRAKCPYSSMKKLLDNWKF